MFISKKGLYVYIIKQTNTDIMALTKEERQMYPKTMIARHFKFDSDTRDARNETYALETIVNNSLEESRWYEALNHEANIVVEIKLSNGVIKKQTGV